MSRRLHVAVVAPCWLPVPPHGYGGIELVVSLLIRQLRARGFDVTLFGAEGSEPGTRVKAPSSWGAEIAERWAASYREVAYTSRVIADLRQLKPDLVHDHAGLPSLMGLTLAGVAPVISTVHGPAIEPLCTALEAMATPGHQWGLVAISRHQRSSAPSLPWRGVVHNAADVESLRVCVPGERDDYLLSLARISPEKGQHLAIDVARRTGRRLILAGKIGETAAEQAYFREQVQPHIDGDRVEHVLNVAGPEKTELLARAHAFLATPTWPEPFGVAVLEAMASGTPVCALNRGALGELVTDGLTGFVVETVEDMALAVDRATEIDATHCADHARRRFGAAAMADRYVQIYSDMLFAAQTPATVVPRRPVLVPDPMAPDAVVARARSQRRPAADASSLVGLGDGQGPWS